MTRIISLLALPVLIAAYVILAVTGSLFSPSPLVIAAQVLAVGLSIWARRSFPKGAFRVAAAPAASAVIRRGPYRFIRHPMYAANLLFLWAAVLSHASAWTVALAVAVTAVVSVRIVFEERILRERYAAEYETYTRETKAVIPFLI